MHRTESMTVQDQPRKATMKKLLLAGAIVLAFANLPAKADTVVIDDPLHGICTGCVDNGTNTPLNGTGTFGFASSPPGATGVLWLNVLVPNNTNLALFTAPSITGFAAGTPSLFSTTAWTTGTINAYLGGSFLNGSPDNGIGAYLPATQGLDPGATGFFDFLFNAGAVGGTGLGGTGDPLKDTFTLNGLLPVGSYITAMMLTTDNQGNPTVINTANSAALLVNQQMSPVPIPAVGTGLPGIFAGVLLLLRWARRRREGLHLPSATPA